MTRIHKSLALSALITAPLLYTPVADAFDYTVSGFIRQEMAYKLNNNENELNRATNKANGTASYPGGKILALVPGIILPKDRPINSKGDRSGGGDWNVFATRAEVDIKATFTNNLTGFMKIRGYFQPDVFGNTRDSASHDGEGGKVNYFNVNNHGNEATYLSVSNNNYMVDIPAMYLDWASGPYWVRFGQQQIAWGESLFFRIADQTAGLDFRRHFIFDFGSEEFADERLSAPGIRASMVFGEGWEIEGFATMFQPSVLPPNYSQYNVIFSGFSPDYKTGFDKVSHNVNAGLRLSGEVGGLGMQFFAITQHNYDPVFHLKPGGQKLMPDQFCESRFIPKPAKLLCGFENQPFVFEENGTGVTSAGAWYDVGAISAMDTLDVLNGIAEDYPWIANTYRVLGLNPDKNGDTFTTIADGGPNSMYGLIPEGVNGTDFVELFFAVPVYDLVRGPQPTYDSNGVQNGTELIRLNSLVGLIEANYTSQNVFGFGFNYIFYAEPDTLLDQLVVRFEASYTPDKKFTHALRNTFLEKDEWLTSLVFEKYHRFSDAFPATFFIFQWMHRTQSDLLGRHLSGLGGTSIRRPGGGEQDHGWDGFVFAFQQPFPGLRWRLDMSVLYGLSGGVFFQPSVRWKPNADWTVEVFANIIDGERGSAFQPFDFSDDINARISYSF